MTLKSICTSVELSKQLKEAGCPQDSLFYWRVEIDNGEEYPEIWDNKPDERDGVLVYSAFTSTELLKKLPKYIGELGFHHTLYQCYDFNTDWRVYYESAQEVKFQAVGKNQLVAMAKMLLYLDKEGVIDLCK